jgi:hypothetical protein
MATMSPAPLPSCPSHLRPPPARPPLPRWQPPATLSPHRRNRAGVLDCAHAQLPWTARVWVEVAPMASPTSSGLPLARPASPPPPGGPSHWVEWLPRSCFPVTTAAAATSLHPLLELGSTIGQVGFTFHSPLWCSTAILGFPPWFTTIWELGFPYWSCSSIHLRLWLSGDLFSDISAYWHG